MNIIIDNEVWCELEVEGSICKYKFFLLNIPCLYGGHKKTGYYDDYYLRSSLYPMPPEVIAGEIYCDSSEEARQCALSIERLIRSGYGDQEMQYGGWLVGIDMAIIFMQFNGEPMRFLHHTFESSFDVEGLMQIQQKIKDAGIVFHYFLLPEKDTYNGCSSEVDEAYEKILPDGDAELIWQFSIPNDCKRTVSIWYR